MPNCSFVPYPNACPPSQSPIQLHPHNQFPCKPKWKKGEMIVYFHHLTTEYIPQLLSQYRKTIAILPKKYSISTGLHMSNDNDKQALNFKIWSSHYLLSFCKLPPNNTMNNVLPNRQIKNISR